jgi:hypothetical protein
MWDTSSSYRAGGINGDSDGDGGLGSELGVKGDFQKYKVQSTKYSVLTDGHRPVFHAVVCFCLPNLDEAGTYHHLEEKLSSKLKEKVCANGVPWTSLTLR